MVKLLLLCGDTNRARSYASILKKHIKCNITGLLYGIEKVKNINKTTLNIDLNTEKYLKSIEVSVPELNKDIESMFIDNQWEYFLVKQRNYIILLVFFIFIS